MLSQDINPSLNQHLFEDFKWDQKFLDRVNKIDFHFYFLVMGTGKDITPQDRQLKILRVRPSQERDELLQELLDKTIMAYEYYEKHNWPAKPGKRCGGCPLSPQQCIHKSMEEAI